MRLVTDRPQALKDAFVLMGVVEDSFKQYGCLLNASDGKIHIEEVYWTGGVRGNSATANLRAVDNDSEWAAVYSYVTEKTTILSPKKLRMAIQIARSRGAKMSAVEALIKKNYPYFDRVKTGDGKHQIALPGTSEDKR